MRAVVWTLTAIVVIAALAMVTQRVRYNLCMDDQTDGGRVVVSDDDSCRPTIDIWPFD